MSINDARSGLIQVVVGELAERCDVLVIGAGPGGYVAALRCAQQGKKVTLVERDRLGGTCLNIGCIPSKVLIHVAEIAHLPETSSALGVHLEATVDLDEVQDHIGEVVAGLTGGVGQLLTAAGVTTVTGHARFSKPQRVAVTSGDSVRHIEFDECVLATGSRPIELPDLPFDNERVIDSTGALELRSVPGNLVIVGGGYIGVELGTAWAKLGSKVTILEAAARLLPELDRRLGSVVARRLRELGVDVRTNAMALGFVDGLVRYRTGEDTTDVSADVVIVAVGRRPNTDDLGLDKAGVGVSGNGLIEVGPDRRASPHVFAIGDITPGHALAHKATSEAEVAAATIAGKPAAFDPAAIPAVVFSDPEIATVGLSLDEAISAGHSANDFRFPFTAGSRSRTLNDTAGFVQIVADEAGTVLGVHMVGAGVSELAAYAALAIELAATVEELSATIHAHPTMSEALAEAAHGLTGHPLHVTR